MTCQEELLYNRCFYCQIIHEKLHDEIVAGLVKAYGQLRVGDPIEGKYGIIDYLIVFSGNPVNK